MHWKTIPKQRERERERLFCRDSNPQPFYHVSDPLPLNYPQRERQRERERGERERERAREREKTFPPLLPGLEPATFRSRVRPSTAELSAPHDPISAMVGIEKSTKVGVS